jgi:hypothetical protein
MWGFKVHIFISYSRANTAFVKTLASLLRSALDESTIWYDEGIDPGDYWWERIEREIVACNFFLFLISDSSLNSYFCQQELQKAVDQHKRILPVLVQGDTDLSLLPTPLREEIQRIQHVNMSEGPQDAHALMLLVRVMRHNEPLGEKRATDEKPDALESEPTQTETNDAYGENLYEIFGDLIKDIYIPTERPQLGNAQDTLMAVWKDIFQASLCVFDLTFATSNTYIELGMAIAINRNIIVLADGKVEIPAFLDAVTFRYDTLDAAYDKLGSLRQADNNFFKSAVKEYCYLCNKLCSGMSAVAVQNTYLILNNSRMRGRGLYNLINRSISQNYKIFPAYLSDMTNWLGFSDLRQRVLSSEFVIAHIGLATDALHWIMLGMAIGSLKPWILFHELPLNDMPSLIRKFSSPVHMDALEAESTNIVARVQSVISSMSSLQQTEYGLQREKEGKSSRATAVQSRENFWYQLDDWVKSLTHRPGRREEILGMLNLVKVRHNEFVQKHRVPPGYSMIFGRDMNKCMVKLESEKASKVHFRLFEEKGQYFIEDLRSTNFTYLNGVLLPPNKPTEVFFKDEIRVVGEKFLVWDDRDLPQTVPPNQQTGMLNTGYLTASGPQITLEFDDVLPPTGYTTWDQKITLKAKMPNSDRNVHFEIQEYYDLVRVLGELVKALSVSSSIEYQLDPQAKYHFEFGTQVVGPRSTPVTLGLKDGDMLIIALEKSEVQLTEAIRLAERRLKSCENCKTANQFGGEATWKIGTQQYGHYRELVEVEFNTLFGGQLPNTTPLPLSRCPNCGRDIRENTVIGVGIDDSMKKA